MKRVNKFKMIVANLIIFMLFMLIGKIIPKDDSFICTLLCLYFLTTVAFNVFIIE